MHQRSLFAGLQLAPRLPSAARLHRLSALTTFALAAALTAQSPRLVDTVAAPLAYLSLENAPAAATGTAATRRQPGAVQRLLADPALTALLTNGRADAAAGGAAGGAAAEPAGAKVLVLVRGLLARSGDVEIALTGIVPDVGRPLLVLRARLQDGEGQRLAKVLAGGELAAPSRQVASRQAYKLKHEGRDALGQEVELAVVGDDLIVGNDSLTFAEVLTPSEARTAATPNAGLAADVRFQALRKQVAATPGALQLYVDWPRLGHRLGSAFDGVAGALLRSSGLDGARAVMATLQPTADGTRDNGGFTATLLLDFDAGREPLRSGPDTNDANGVVGDPFGGDPFAGALDGWLRAVQPVAARALLPELPAAGLGGLVLSVDLGRVVGRSPEGAHLLADIHRAFDQYGLDFERNFASRLGDHGTVQLQVARSAQAVAELRSVYALRTRSKAAATDLFNDLRRATEAAGLGRLLPARPQRERRNVDVLELRGRGPAALTAFVSIVDDSLLIAADEETLAAAVDDARSAARPRARRDQLVQGALAAIGDGQVAGLFDVDLAPLFAQLVDVLGGGAKLDSSQLPRRHVGSLELHRSERGTVVRIRVLSSR